MSKEILVLSQVQAREFEEKGSPPNPEHCRFCSYADIRMLEAGTHPKYPHREFRWVGEHFDMITLLPCMILRSREGVVCLVRGVVQGHTTGVRKWRASRGALAAFAC